MAKFLNGSIIPKVLILDPNSTPLNTTDKSYRVAVAACQRHGCYWEHVNTSDISDSQLSDEWDLVLVPVVSSGATNYSNLDTALKNMRSTAPVAVMSADGSAANGTTQGITGATGQTSAKALVCDTFNWQGRSLTQMTFYGIHATGLNASATSIATDGTEYSAWQFDVGSHPTLWLVGYSQSVNPSNAIYKPWLCFQWMIDQASTSRKSTLQERVRPSYCLLRIDAFDNNEAVTAYGNGNLQAWYDACLGLREIWHAAYGQGANNPGTNDAATAQWFADRNENQGGLLRAMNHHNDVVDATGGAGVACTSNGTSFDQFVSAGVSYEAVCDIFTGTYNMKLGSDGYGRGYPNVQNSNNMNNPAALFLAGGDNPYRVRSGTNWYGGYGCHLMVSESDTYPTAGETPAARKVYSHNWNGGQTVAFASDTDTGWGGANTAAINYNNGVVKAYLYCGGVYIHAPQCDDFTNYAPDYVSNFIACPDVFKSGPWEDMLVELQRGSGALIYI